MLSLIFTGRSGGVAPPFILGLALGRPTVVADRRLAGTVVATPARSDTTVVANRQLTGTVAATPAREDASTSRVPPPTTTSPAVPF